MAGGRPPAARSAVSTAAPQLPVPRV